MASGLAKETRKAIDASGLLDHQCVAKTPEDLINLLLGDGGTFNVNQALWPTEPAPLDEIGAPSAGRYRGGYQLDPKCRQLFEMGQLTGQPAADMAQLATIEVVRPPSVANIEVWSPFYKTKVRQADTATKALTIWKIRDQDGMASETVAMDVPVADAGNPDLLVAFDAGNGRQPLVVDVHPLQQITFTGLGYAAPEGRPDRRVRPLARLPGRPDRGPRLHGRGLRGRRGVAGRGPGARRAGRDRRRPDGVRMARRRRPPSGPLPPARPLPAARRQEGHPQPAAGPGHLRDRPQRTLRDRGALLRGPAADRRDAGQGQRGPDALLGDHPPAVLAGRYRLDGPSASTACPSTSSQPTPTARFSDRTDRNWDVGDWRHMDMPADWTPQANILPDGEQSHTLQFGDDFHDLLTIQGMALELDNEADRAAIKVLLKVGVVVLAALVVVISVAIAVIVCAILFAADIFSAGVLTVVIGIIAAATGAWIGFVLGTAATMFFKGVDEIVDSVVVGAERITSGATTLTAADVAVMTSKSRFVRRTLESGRTAPAATASETVTPQAIRESFEGSRDGGRYRMTLEVARAF